MGPREIFHSVEREWHGTKAQASSVVLYALFWRLAVLAAPILLLCAAFSSKTRGVSGRASLLLVVPLIALGASGVLAEIAGSFQALLARKGDEAFGMSWAFFIGMKYAFPQRSGKPQREGLLRPSDSIDGNSSRE